MSIGTPRKLLVATFGALAAVLAVVVVLNWDNGGTPASASSPSPGLQWSISVEGAGCDTTAGDAKCTLDPGAEFNLIISLDSMGDSFTSYEGYDISLTYSGVTSKETREALWPECEFPAANYGDGTVLLACALGLANQESSHEGAMDSTAFNCAASGEITLVHGGNQSSDGGNTQVTDVGRKQHDEGATSETLTINCGAGGEPTDTPTEPSGPTNTPTASATGTPTTPMGPTNTPTNTPTTAPATNTPTRTNTPTVTPTSEVEPGDVNGDGVVNSLDALWVLWFDAEMVQMLPHPEVADVNGDGMVNSIDALWILWIEANLITV